MLVREIDLPFYWRVHFMLLPININPIKYHFYRVAIIQTWLRLDMKMEVRLE